MYRKGVTKSVWGDVLLDAGLFLIEFDNLPEALPAHAFTVHIHEQGFLAAIRDQLRTYIFHIILNGFNSGVLQRDHSLLATAFTADKTASCIKITQIQRDQLTNPDTSGI